MANCDFKGFGGCFVKEFPLEQGNLVLKQRWLSLFHANSGNQKHTGEPVSGSSHSQAQASLLVLPGYVLITTQPHLCGQLAGIAELQFRQDEVKQDFSHAIEGLLMQITRATPVLM
ncbi:hypothetical protein KIH87_12525 [Paraneptunicella aestuarii]|uniref:hypothetical protein n=1 Tax=Paraneptunicella aestuarii TaxID=2831148 RepID=UPI001E283966|nr:hypothetical protein [Paraneptunicella aestuarii]UAA37536.1 hypothetical protein KIH87_12525 [Paraneptunicella aestuarii]